jgi:hypothetical protein
MTAAFAVLVAVAAFGCGGSDDSGDTALAEPIETSSLTKAQFVKRADAICAKVEPAIESKSAAYEKQHPSVAEQGEEKLVAAMTDSVLVPAMQEAIDGIRKLGAPRGDEQQVEGILVAMQEANDNAEETRITEYLQFGEEFRGSSKAAQRYGLKECTFGL